MEDIKEVSNEIEEGAEKKSRIDLILKKYNIDLKKLEEEQRRIAKDLNLQDNLDFSLADRFAAFDNIFINNRLLSGIIVCDKEFEIIDSAYSYEKVSFPYIPGFRNFREIIPMINAYDKLKEKPDVVFVPAQGIIHPRLGLASQFGLTCNVATIGVSNSYVDCIIDNDNLLRGIEVVGKILKTKEGSNPMYLSPGNLISVNSAYEIAKKMINLPHKRPEPLHLASKYTKEVRKELINSS